MRQVEVLAYKATMIAEDLEAAVSDLHQSHYDPTLDKEVAWAYYEQTLGLLRKQLRKLDRIVKGEIKR